MAGAGVTVTPDGAAGFAVSVSGLLVTLRAVSVTFVLPPGANLTREDFRRETEKLLHGQCQSGGGVMVGRAAAVFLREHPGVLRVRLDGPREARLRQAMAVGGVDEETASRTLDQLDQAQAAYARELYGADLADPSHYHLMIDSTAVDLDTCLTLILTAAGAPEGIPDGGATP